MKKMYFKQTMVATLLFFNSYSDAQTLLHYWNFNDNTSVATITTPTVTNISGVASISTNISGISAIDFAGGTKQNFDVLNLNTRNSDAAGAHLRFNDPIGSTLIFALPTSGYEDLIVKFATRRSGSGAGTQVWSYSTDGTNYTFLGNVIPNNGDPALATLDFSSISGADNNSNFKLKVEFQLAPGGDVGNNRFDNFTAEGTLFSGVDTTIPTAVFSPANAATGIFSTIQPSIDFSENVRLANNDAITDTNVDAIVELRLNNASGTLVPFDAVFSLNKITIIPTTPLENNQLYYVGLLDNTVEDTSDNAIATAQSTSFTTTTPTVNLSVNNSVGKEAGTTVITVTATSNFAVNGNQTISLGVAGTNITAADYTLSNTTITILNGQTTGSVSFTVTDDALVENTESAVLTLSNPSAGIALGTTTSQPITIIDNDAPLDINLSNYVRVGRYDLPEPKRTTAPTNNLLSQEASGVTYNWDTDTLFIVGDGTTSVTQVSKTGELIDTMTLAQGGSAQGTEFYDSEGITYIGNGQFVMTEERDRQVVLFTYAAGTTLTRANAKTVKLGTFVPNTGTEGLSYDPITGGYIVLKEIDPIGIFQTGIDFNAGTATNGSATTENSTNLFNPALMGFTDVADVFALSNLPALNGQPLFNNLLVLSQENAKVVNIDRNGNITNSLTIVTDPGNPLSATNQQHEGLTMDRDGILYIVNENGGGDIDHPQLWVYAPSSLQNLAPTAIALANTTTTILENTNTASAVKVADILVTDDGLGTNNFTLSGADANFFEITGAGLYIKAGTVLDYETKTSYNITINVDDTTVGTTPDASVNYTLALTDVVNETIATATVTISEVAPWSSGNTLVGADWFEVTNNGTTALDITGWKVDDSSNKFTDALSLAGITTIAPGESVIFIEEAAANTTTNTDKFKSTWFDTNVPAGFQIGTYTGGGMGLGTGGDALNLFDPSGNLMANVAFGASTTNLSFNNAVGLNNTTITTLSQAGVNDAFTAAKDANQIGSPGSVGKLFISEVAPWSSSSNPVLADWFEVTNTKAVAIDITGWKIDDDSQSPIAAVALNGITSINPGESVIFIGTNDLATKSALFLSNWFGNTPPAGLRIGNFDGIGLSSGGDQVNLYNGTSNIPQASIWVGASPSSPYATFDNTAGVRTNITQQTTLSTVGVNGAVVAVNNANEIGSPGTITNAATQNLSIDTSSGLISSFKVTAYPVPYNSTFQLNATTVSYDQVEVKVYDMNGKLVEARQFDANGINEQQLGNNYSTGIYNIIVTQGENTKTLRVIKK